MGQAYLNGENERIINLLKIQRDSRHIADPKRHRINEVNEEENFETNLIDDDIVL